MTSLLIFVSLFYYVLIYISNVNGRLRSKVSLSMFYAPGPDPYNGVLLVTVVIYFTIFKSFYVYIMVLKFEHTMIIFEYVKLFFGINLNKISTLRLTKGLSGWIPCRNWEILHTALVWRRVVSHIDSWPWNYN